LIAFVGETARAVTVKIVELNVVPVLPAIDVLRRREPELFVAVPAVQRA
jgi:hypothetical protein